MPGRSQSARVLAGLVLLTCTALCLRVLPARETVFPEPGRVLLLGNDAYYSLRHARFVAHHFPELQRWDVGTRYPTGMRSYTTGLYEWAIGATAWAISAGAPTDGLVDIVAAWMPAVLGALGIPALWWMVRQAASARIATLATLSYLLYPGLSLPRTTLGFSDHHAAEILLLLLSVGAFIRVLRHATTNPRSPLRSPAFLGALPMTLFLFTWNGAPLDVIVLGVAACACTAFEFIRGREARPAVAGSMRYFSSVLVLTAAIGLFLPQWVIEPGHFPLLLLMLLGFAAAPWLLTRLASLLASRGLRRWKAILLSGLLVLIAPAVLAFLLPGGEALLRILATKSPLIAEHRKVDWDYLLRGYGLLPVFMLWAVPTTLYAAARRRSARWNALLMAVGTGLMILWWQTHDYGYAAAPFVSVLAVLALDGTRRMLDPAVLRPIPARTAIVLTLLILPLWPLRLAVPPSMTAERLGSLILLDEPLRHAMEWLRTSTPEPTLPVDTPVRPFGDDLAYPDGTWGVLCSWEIGNFVNALGRRPSVWSQGLSPHSAEWFTIRDEQESLDWLAAPCRGEERIRYVIVDGVSLGPGFISKALVSGLQSADLLAPIGRTTLNGEKLMLFGFGKAFEGTVAFRLGANFGSGLSRYRLAFTSAGESLIGYEQNGRGIGRIEVPAEMARHPVEGRARPGTVHAFMSPNGLVHSVMRMPKVMVFEVVAGARISGSAPPAGEVLVTLDLAEDGSGRRVVWTRRTRVDASGRFEVTVPYPTTGEPPRTRWRARGSYVLSLGGVRKEVPVESRQVMEGARIDLGDITAD